MRKQKDRRTPQTRKWCIRYIQLSKDEMRRTKRKRWGNAISHLKGIILLYPCTDDLSAISSSRRGAFRSPFGCNALWRRELDARGRQEEEGRGTESSRGATGDLCDGSQSSSMWLMGSDSYLYSSWLTSPPLGPLTLRPLTVRRALGPTKLNVSRFTLQHLLAVTPPIQSSPVSATSTLPLLSTPSSVQGQAVVPSKPKETRV
jgi:hypothetical protein